ncbi:hypothetical protein JOQ06_013914, partial [Pogonophryne albipinna]
MQSKELRREISQLRDELRSAVDRVSSRTKSLEDRVESEDLEARSRRCNLRITGIQEKREAGKNPTDFVAKLLQETLGLEKEPLLDICHRTLRERPQEDQPPRAFVVRCHYYQEKEATLRKAATDPTTSHIRLYPSSREAESRLQG